MLARESTSYFDDAFEFTTNYMIVGAWATFTASLPDDITTTTDNFNSYIGFAIAGIETSDAKIGEMTETIMFKGTGNGVYNSEALSYTPAFDLTATIDFSARTIGLKTLNTIQCFDNVVTYPCVNQFPLSYLDFTAELNYEPAKNNINGTVSVACYGRLCRSPFLWHRR